MKKSTSGLAEWRKRYGQERRTTEVTSDTRCSKASNPHSPRGCPFCSIQPLDIRTNGRALRRITGCSLYEVDSIRCMKWIRSLTIQSRLCEGRQGSAQKKAKATEMLAKNDELCSVRPSSCLPLVSCGHRRDTSVSCAASDVAVHTPYTGKMSIRFTAPVCN